MKYFLPKIMRLIFLFFLSIFINSNPIIAQIKDWTFLGLENQRIMSIIVNPNNPQIIYLGVHANSYLGTSGVFKSLYSGATWDTTNLTGYDIWNLTYDPTNPDIVYAVGYDNSMLPSVFKTADAGTTWYNCSNFTNLYWETFANTVVVHPSHPCTVYVGVTGLGGGTLLQSNNGGNDWFELLPYSNNSCEVITINPFNPNNLFIGSHGSIKKSIDGGQTWENMYNTGSTIWCMDIDKKNPCIIYAGTQSRGFFKSVDGGSTWMNKNEGLLIRGQYMPYINAIAIHPQQSNIIYLGTNYHGIFYSNNGGELWHPARPQIPDSSVFSVIFYHNDEILVGTENGIWRGCLTTDVDNDGDSKIPSSMLTSALYNYPNPFNQNTTIEFEMNKRDLVKLKIYDVSGRLVRNFIEIVAKIGNNQIIWDGRDYNGDLVSSGIYYGILSIPSKKARLKMIVLR